MRAIYDQTAGDTHALFRDATERFAETVRDMKQMAAEMQRELETTRAEMHRELEATRNELRRGIFELPQETAESAAQMRRVIVDQIEALAELNRIVARHGRNLDAVEPRRRRARTPRSPPSARRSELPPARRPRAATSAASRPPPRRAETPALSPIRPAAPRTAAPAGSPICSTAPRAKTPSRNATYPREYVTRLAARAAREPRAAPTSARPGTASSRSIRSRSTSPA